MQGRVGKALRDRGQAWWTYRCAKGRYRHLARRRARKQVIEKVLIAHPDVIVDDERRREIRYIINIKDWIVEAEILFWINRPEEEEFIKSNILENIKNAFEEEKTLPPIPSILRKEFLGIDTTDRRGIKRARMHVHS